MCFRRAVIGYDRDSVLTSDFTMLAETCGSTVALESVLNYTGLEGVLRERLFLV